MTGEILKILNRWKNPFIVIGDEGHFLMESLISWIEQIKTPFFADITSGIKTQIGHLPHAVTSLDSPFVLNYLRDEVDGILHIGGPVISQNYMRMLDGLPSPKVVQVAPYFFDRILPQRVLHHQRLFSWQSPQGLQWPNRLCPALVKGEEVRRRLFAEKDFCHPSHYHAVREIEKTITKDHLVIVGNSTPVRIFNDYFYSVPKKVSWQFQRGASGIEGLIARAVGAAKAAQQKKVLCVLGDISAFHDLSSLLWELPVNLKVLILNNQRGGLFDRLKRPPQLEPFIDTPHDLQFSTLCKHWPCWNRRAPSLEHFLMSGQEGGNVWELLIDHQKDMEEWKELI